ncbi:MAG TPA: transporter [Methylomirabilota bacterium]
MRRHALLLGLALAMSFAGVAGALEIEPNRPSNSVNAKIVPPGGFQIESGIAISSERKAGEPRERLFEVDVDLRVGVTRNLEIDVSDEPLVRLRGLESDTGHGDITLGFKYRFLEPAEGEAWPPHLGVKPFVKLPTASAPIGTERPDFGLLLLASFDLPSRFGLDLNVGGVAVGQTRPNGYLGQAVVAASLSRTVMPGFSVFGEIFYNSPKEHAGRDLLGFDAGAVYLLSPRIAVDVGAQTSLHGRGPDWVVRTGVSVLFGGR